MADFSKPLSVDEIEFTESFVDRVVKPFLQRLVVAAGRITPASNVDQLRKDLVIAGNPGNLAVIDFLGIKLLTGILVGIVVFLVLLARQIPTASALLFSIAGVLIGLYFPNFWLRSRIKQRQHAIAKALPDALDMLTICVDAGLGFDAALMKVADKWDNELTREFSRVINEIRMGVRRSEALRHMAERTDVPEVATFVAVMVQADRLGVGITDVLHSQSEQMRMRRRQRAEEEARKAPIKMMIPLVLFIFPAMFAVILGPAVPRFVRLFGSGGGL
ncbi:MAG TPA: type II secretion system F family protein [Anaerolineae bacterium]|nr:type II secretion system F family protein [Anaerolineae bacterium]